MSYFVDRRGVPGRVVKMAGEISTVAPQQDIYIHCGGDQNVGFSTANGRKRRHAAAARDRQSPGPQAPNDSDHIVSLGRHQSHRQDARPAGGGVIAAQISGELG